MLGPETDLHVNHTMGMYSLLLIIIVFCSLIFSVIYSESSFTRCNTMLNLL